MVFVSCSVSSASIDDFEYKLKALYIARLVDFIAWPDDEKKSTFKICINSTDKVAIELKKIELEDIIDKQVEIIDPPTDSSITTCNFLYISRGKVDPTLSNAPVFTLSSQTHFAEQGGMIEFYIDQNKIRMKVNLIAVNKAGLKVSSKLMLLLTVVKL